MSSDEHPTKGDPDAELAAADRALRADHVLGLEEIETRRFQLSISPRDRNIVETLWCRTKEIVEKTVHHHISVVRSSHSIDVLAPGVSKTNIVEAFGERFGAGELLRIGDRGRWPGNDFALLDHRLGLSVDDCSFDPNACWNFCPAGYRGLQATLYYLKRINGRSGLLRIKFA